VTGEPPNEETERIRAVYQGYRALAESKWSRTNAGNLAMVRERNAVIVRMLRAAGIWPLEGRRILDVGCGGGDLLSFFQSQGTLPGDLFGVDLLPERIDEARRNFRE